MKFLKDISIQYIKGVGPARKRLFRNLGIESVEDLMCFFPRRYEDRTKITSVLQAQVGEYQLISGKVVDHEARKSWYTKKHVSEVVIDDGTGRIFCVWFNQPYLDRYFKPAARVILYGKVDVYKNRLQMVSPEYEIIATDEDQSLGTGRIVPVYPLTRGMTQRYLRKVVRRCLDKYRDDATDLLPVWLRNKYRLSSIKRTLENLHFPESFEMQESAHRRVSFEEFFFFQISVMKRRMSVVRKEGTAHSISSKLINRFAGAFLFELTGAQKRVIDELAGDMRARPPMLRLLQGDVGSGKTLVAVFGCVAAWANKKQSAIMAPTEILAYQHYRTVQKMLDTAPFKGLKVALLVGSLKKKEKGHILDQLKSGQIDLVIGTHALLSEAVDFKNLSFVVIDEQHKFGVRQRALLSRKGNNPDVLVMTATPIPRTLSLTLFGDLDVSVIDEMPKGHGKIATRLYGIDQAQDVYKQARTLVESGQQAYIVYPLVEESDKLSLKAAVKMFAHFKANEFKGLRLGLVHGQMKKQNSDMIMEQFKAREIDILVATTVLEVGVDVPNAGVIVIEHAQRFGLSQLHQLRGRVGRGQTAGTCFLIADPSTEDGTARLKAIVSTLDGFKIAEQDLAIRGPGHYFGRHQHGLNELKFANPLTQIDILEIARKEAQEIVRQDPDLKDSLNIMFAKIIKQRYPDYLEMVEAG